MPHLSDFTICASFGTESKDFLRSINSFQELFKVNASIDGIAKEHHHGEWGVVLPETN